MVKVFQNSHSAVSLYQSSPGKGRLTVQAVIAKRRGVCTSNVLHICCAEMRVLACRRASTHQSPSAASPSTMARSCLFQAPIPSFNTWQGRNTPRTPLNTYKCLHTCGSDLLGVSDTQEPIRNCLEDLVPHMLSSFAVIYSLFFHKYLYRVQCPFTGTNQALQTLIDP